MTRWWQGILACGLHALSGSAVAHDSGDCSPVYDSHAAAVWDRANDWSFLSKTVDVGLFFSGVYGTSSSDDLGELKSGGHDPVREDWGVQAIEPNVLFRPHKSLAVFANGLWFTDESGAWESELEEAFVSAIDLPGGLRLRAGQMLNQVGIHNANHVHSWQEVDAPMVISRFLGDDGLLTRSVEVAWDFPWSDPWHHTSRWTVSYGAVRPHDEHGDHDEDHRSMFEAEGAGFNEQVFTTRFVHTVRVNDFHRLSFGASYVFGDNEFGRTNHIAGIDAEYSWRERGRAVGGAAFRWRAEAYGRRVGAVGDEFHDDGHHEHEETIRDEFNELGAYTAAVYSWNDQLDTGLRIGYLSGIDPLGLDERIRVSPSVTFYTDQTRRVHIRGQYDFDHLGNIGSEHSLWLQIGVQLGSIAHVE